MKGANQEGGGKAGCLRPGEAEQAPSYYHQPLYFPLQSYRTSSIIFSRQTESKDFIKYKTNLGAALLEDCKWGGDGGRAAKVSESKSQLRCTPISGLRGQIGRQ